MIQLRASDANRWAYCTGAPLLPQVEDEEGAAAKAGTLAHKVVESLWRGGEAPAEATPDLVDMAQAFVEWLRVGTQYNLAGVEMRFLDIFPRVSGTADFAADGQRPGAHYLRVADLKTGRVNVEAVDNMQLLAYAIGALKRWSGPLHKGVDEVELVIYQPLDWLGGPVKRWTLSWVEFQERAEWLRLRAAEASSGKGTLSTGAHCRYCRSRVFCPAFLQRAQDALELQGVPAESVDLSPQALGAALDHLNRSAEVIKAAKEALEGLATSRIDKGQGVPGWIIDSKPGKRYWSASIPEIKMVEALTGAKLTTEAPVSITDALKYKSARALIEPLFGRGSGKPTLVPFNPNNAKEVFK